MKPEARQGTLSRIELTAKNISQAVQTDLKVLRRSFSS
jgi:hypothetical protein